jgi:signal recognition particle GTPase
MMLKMTKRMESAKFILKPILSRLDQSADLNLESTHKMIHILEEMTEAEKRTNGKLSTSQIQSIARRAGCTISDVQLMLKKYQDSHSVMKTILKLNQEGKPIPSDLNELKDIIQKTCEQNKGT